MTVREATKRDLKTIIKYKKAMFKDAGLEHLLHPLASNIIYREYKRLYRRNDAVHYLIEEGGEIISIAGGFIKSDIPYKFYKNPRYGFIGDVYTLPEHRKRGYATTLFKTVEKWLFNRGITEIKLLSSEDGREIYRKAGYIECKDLMIKG